MKQYALKYKGFEQNLVEAKIPDIFGRATYRFKFENGYGAMVSADHNTRYRTLWNVALLNFKNKSYGELNYNNPIMADSEMYLTDKDVRKLLQEIKDYTE